MASEAWWQFMVEPDTLRRAATRPSHLQTYACWKAAPSAPLHLKLLFICHLPNITQSRLLQASLLQACFFMFFPRKKLLKQAESKEIPSLGSSGKIIVLKVFEMFEDGQTFMAFWKGMILKEPSYYTTIH